MQPKKISPFESWSREKHVENICAVVKRIRQEENKEPTLADVLLCIKIKQEEARNNPHSVDYIYRLNEKTLELLASWDLYFDLLSMQKNDTVALVDALINKK